jgi:hypothetical protein
MDSEVLPLFYPEDYKADNSGMNVVLLNHDKHPPERFWYTTETLWKFKISLCETAPIAIFSSHFGSNMPLKPDIAKFYETLTEAEDFKYLRYEISVEALDREIKSQLKHNWSLIDLRVSSTSSTSIEGEGLLKPCNTIYGDSRAIPGLSLEFHPTCPFPNCCNFSPKAARVVEHYKKEHKHEIPNSCLNIPTAQANAKVRGFMDSKYSAKWSIPRATQRFSHEKNGSVFATTVRVRAPGAETYYRDKAGQILDRQRAGGRAARLEGINADGAKYKGIRLVEPGNIVGGSTDDPFARDPRVLKKLQRIIDLLKFIRPSAVRHIQQCSQIVTMTLQVTEAIMSLQVKQNITLENSHLMRRCDIHSTSYKGYLFSFVKMVELGLIASNAERLEFTDRSLDANQIRAARVAISELFSLGRETKNLFRHLFSECRRLVNAGITPLPSRVNDDVSNVKAFTKNGISTRSLQKSIDSIDEMVEIFHTVFEDVYRIVGLELDSLVKEEGTEGEIVLLNNFHEPQQLNDDGLENDIIRVLDELDGEAFDEADGAVLDVDMIEQPRARHGQVNVHLPGLRRMMDQNENNEGDQLPGRNPQDEGNEERYGEISNWLVTSLLYTLIGSEKVVSARERSKRLIHIYAVTRNVFWFEFLLKKASGAFLEVPTLFAGYNTMHCGTIRAIRKALEPGRETVGTVLQTLKRSTSKVVDSFVTRTTRAVMNELTLSCEIPRITQLNVLNNLNLKNTVSHEDIRTALDRLRVSVLDNLCKLLHKESINDILALAPDDLEHWIYINGRPPNVSSVFKTHSAYTRRQVDAIIHRDDFDFSSWFGRYEAMLIAYIAILQLSQGGQLFRCSEVYGSFVSSPTNLHGDGIHYIPQLQCLILVNTKMKSVRLRNEVGFQGIFIRDTKLAVAVLSIAKSVYLSILARYQALELQSPRRAVEDLISDASKRLVAISEFGNVSNERFRRLLVSKMYTEIGITASNGSYQELRQIMVQLSSCLNIQSVRSKIQEINNRVINNHLHRIEEAHYVQWTSIPTCLKISTITVLYERYIQFQTLIVHSGDVIANNRRAVDQEFNRFDYDGGERALNHADASADGRRNIADNADNHNYNEMENDNTIHMDNDNNSHHNDDVESNNSDGEEGNLIGIEAVNTSFRDEMLTGDIDDQEEEPGEGPIYVASDTEAVESERPQEDPSSPGSLFSNHIGSDDTTLVGSSQPSNLISSKRGMHHSSNMPCEDEKQDYAANFTSSPCPKRSRAPTIHSDIPEVISID